MPRPTVVAGSTITYVREVSSPLRVVKTREPVETGAALTDHSYVDLQEVHISGSLSDCGSGEGASVATILALKAAARARIPVTIVTAEDTFSNMLLTEVSAVNSAETSAYAFDIEISAEEILFFNTGGGGGGSGGTDTGSQSPAADPGAPSSDMAIMA